MNEPSTIAELYKKVDNVLTSNLDLFSGLSVCDVSIEKELVLNDKWQSSFYNGTNKDSNKSFHVSLMISNQVLTQFFKVNPFSSYKSSKYTIAIESLYVNQRGVITIKVRSIVESGVSQRELLKRRLTEHLKAINYSSVVKIPMPKIITSVLAITSKSSSIKDDLISNLKISDENIKIVHCSSSQEIASAINDYSKDYDITALYRGGHEDADMDMFSDESIIDSCVKSNKHIAVALGHDIDNPFIYNVADSQHSTPSSFAKYIQEHNNIAKNSLFDLFKGIKAELDSFANNKALYIDSVSKDLFAEVQSFIKSKTLFIDSRVNDINNSINQVLKEKGARVKDTEKDINHIIEKIYIAKVQQINSINKDIINIRNSISSKHKEKILIKERKKDKVRFYIIIGAVTIVLVGIIVVLLNLKIS